MTHSDLLIALAVVVLAIVSIVFSRRILKLSFLNFFLGLLGLLFGLLVGALVALAVRSLGGSFFNWLALALNVFVAAGVFYLFLVQSKKLISFFQNTLGWRSGFEGLVHQSPHILLDTSILIDGRIEKVIQTNFITGNVIVPRFVLLELQRIADSNDPAKRMKGRKGLEVLNILKSARNIKLEIPDHDDGKKEDVDQKLIKLAAAKRYRLMTVDYNLLQVASIQKVRVLNLNELALALKPVLIPGEEVMVQISQKGKESGQGVGYLVDGTMVVVERGADLVGKTINAKVIRVFQSVAGQMIFVEPPQTKLKAKQ